MPQGLGLSLIPASVQQSLQLAVLGSMHLRQRKIVLRSAAESQEELQAGPEKSATEVAHVSWGAAPAQVLFRTMRYQPPAKQRQPAVVHINYHVSSGS